MRRAGWQVMPGIGAERLEIIRADVLRRNRWSEDSLASIKDLATSLEEEVSSIDRTQAEAAIAGGTLGDLDAQVERLNETQRNEIVRAHVANAAVTAMTEERSGTGFGHWSKLARLSITGEGVVGHKGIGGVDEDRLREFEVGRVIEGRISQFKSAPKVGGSLELSLFASMLYIRGLVDPATAEPRVELDILGKRGR